MPDSSVSIGRTATRYLGSKVLPFCIAPLLACTLLLPGCIAAAAVATISSFTTGDKETATVNVDSPAKQVYASMLRGIELNPAVQLKSKDDWGMSVSVVSGKETATGSVKALNAKQSRLTIHAKHPRGKEYSKALARRTAVSVCRELGVRYQVVRE